MVVRLYPPPSDAQPSPVLTEAVFEAVVKWVTARPNSDVWVTLDHVWRYAVHSAEAAEVLSYVASGRSRRVAALTAVSADGERRSASLDTFGTSRVMPNFHVAWGAPKFDSPTRVARFQEALPVIESLKDLGRSVASDLAYAYVAPGPFGIAEEHAPWSWVRAGGEHPVQVAPLCDEYVFDAFHFQRSSAHRTSVDSEAPPGRQSIAWRTCGAGGWRSTGMVSSPEGVGAGYSLEASRPVSRPRSGSQPICCGVLCQYGEMIGLLSGLRCSLILQCA